VLGRFAVPPPVVFVTAHDDAAVEAFSLRAVDYLLKPVRAARLAEAVARVAQASRVEPAAPSPPTPAPSRSSWAGSRASCR
jgi:DNA-binding LytR/AlgR family response regulator